MIKIFDRSKRRDPEYFEENRVSAHSDHVFYASLQEADAGSSSYFYSLNGLWRFRYARNEQAVVPGYESTDFDCHGWETIPVPAHIQLQGYGHPQYCNVQFPWDGWEKPEDGGAPEGFNPVACYVKYFDLPEHFNGKRVFISFQGAESCVAVWLNGQYIGYGANSFSPAEFELTGKLQAGENKLVAEVMQWNAGSLLEDQDFFRFSGLFRDVYLYAIPGQHIADLTVRTHLDDAYRDAMLEIQMRIAGERPWHAEISLSDGVHELFHSTLPGSAAKRVQTYPIRGPKLWSAEFPNLYRLEICLYDEEGQLQEVIRQKVGFRRFELKGGLMCLNGRRIVLKGVNRHDFCADTGRAVTAEGVRQDLITMKRNNINAVRTSHYPNIDCLCGLCDELGLYVMDENNLESHGTWQTMEGQTDDISKAIPGDHKEYLARMLSRVNDTYQRDKNHASVLIWSCGNESFGGSVIYAMSQKFRELDGTRLVHYEGIFHDRRYPGTSDMESQMYPSAEDIRKFLREHPRRPFLCCEYSHAMGNSLGAMYQYTDLTKTEPFYQGGFLWDFRDQAIRGKTRYGETAYFYGGDFGDRPNDGSFSGNGICYADGSETPKMQEVKYNYQNITVEFTEQEFLVHNDFLFTNTQQYTCVAQLLKNGTCVGELTIPTAVEPQQTGRYPIPFEKQNAPGEYTVEISFRLMQNTEWAQAGYEIAFGQMAYRVREPEKPVISKPFQVIYGDFNIGVKGEDFRVLFDLPRGILSSYQYKGKEMIRSAPIPNFWRAPTENDRGNLMAARYGQWKLASLYAGTRIPSDEQLYGIFQKPEIREEKDSVTLIFSVQLPTSPHAVCQMKYTVHSDAVVDVTLSYDPVKGLPPMPAFGMLLKMDADFDQLSWYGLGPQATYCDRNRGGKLGVYSKLVSEQMARYLYPQECGNLTGVRWASVCSKNHIGLRFEGKNMEFSALPYTPHEIECAEHLFELPPVHSTVIRLGYQMGVGGDDSWGARTHAEFLLDSSVYREFTFRMKGYTHE